MFSITWTISFYVYSNTYEEHIKHLDAVLGKLTTAGFTIIINKCDFCKQGIKFLDHVISNKQVKVDPERFAAILNYLRRVIKKS
jgi:hypothetical protein